jgi:hypothetical protein
VDAEIVNLAAVGRELLLGLDARCGVEEGDVKRPALRVEARGIEGSVSGDLSKLGCRSYERCHFVSERLPKVVLDPMFQLSGVLGRRVEDHIAAGDEGFNIEEPERLK